MKLSVNSICWAPHEHGLSLAAGSSDGSIWIIEQRGDRWIETLVSANAHAVGVTSVSWRPVVAFGALSSAVVPPLQLVSGGCDNAVRFAKDCILRMSLISKDSVEPNFLSFSQSFFKGKNLDL